MSLADKASLLLIPTGYKSQKVYSIFPTDGVGDFDFSRSSSATRIAKNGLITTVAANVPRLEYPMIDGVVSGCPSLILEGARTNLIQYSEDFSNAYWIKQSSTINSNNAISPDGSLNADLYTASSATFDFIETTYSFIVSGYSFSVFAKKGTSDKIDLSLSGTAFTDVRSVSFDLTNKTAETLSGILKSKIEEYPNGWMRCSIYAVTNTSGSGNVRILSGSSNNVSTLYLYGAQLEEGSYPTSYIKSNSGSTTTRSAETCNGAGDASTFSDSQGVLMAEISALADDSSYRSISINNGSTSNYVQIGFDSSGSNKIFGNIRPSGSSFSVPTNNILNFNKILIKYKINDCSLWINGFEVGTDLNGVVSSGLNQLSFDTGGAAKWYGKAKQLQYYNSALTDSELEQLTSWTSFSDMAQAQQYSIK